MDIEDSEFSFQEPGQLADGNLELILVETHPPDSSAGRVPEYRFEMRLAGKGTRMGRVLFRPLCTERLYRYGGNLSYDVNKEFRGNRYAARSCRLIIPFALSHGLESLLITSSPNNRASRRTCELIGASYVDTIETQREPGELGPTCRYRLDLGKPGNQKGVPDFSLWE